MIGFPKTVAVSGTMVAAFVLTAAPSGFGAESTKERNEPAQKAESIENTMHHGDHKMILDMEGMVMNFNDDELPRDCAELRSEQAIVVRAGTEYAARGMTYGFDQHEWVVKPCTKLTVTLINEDTVRHQWMVHGLPRYLYRGGMFHLEAGGGFSKTASFIVPSDDKTYLVHCDISHHMEKGLKGQLKVGRGAGDLPSVPGISGPRNPDVYQRDLGWSGVLMLAIAAIVGVSIGFSGFGRL